MPTLFLLLSLLLHSHFRSFVALKKTSIFLKYQVYTHVLFLFFSPLFKRSFSCRDFQIFLHRSEMHGPYFPAKMHFFRLEKFICILSSSSPHRASLFITTTTTTATFFCNSLHYYTEGTPVFLLFIFYFLLHTDIRLSRLLFFPHPYLPPGPPLSGHQHFFSIQFFVTAHSRQLQ